MFRFGLITSLLFALMMPPFLQQIDGQDSYSLMNLPQTHVHDVTMQQASPDDVRKSSWGMGADIVSSYIWRGSRQGSGPHIQPYLEFSAGCFTAGAWGTVDLNGYEEADLWFAFELPAGFTVGMQDYYLPELSYFDFSVAGGSHAFELNLDWSSDNVWLSANCILNEAGGIGSYGRDLYFEAGFSFEYVSLFMGAGNGWHTEEGGFNICNLGLEVCRELVVSDTFTLPLTARMVINPDHEQLFVTAGISVVFGSGD